MESQSRVIAEVVGDALGRVGASFMKFSEGERVPSHIGCLPLGNLGMSFICTAA